MDGAAEFLAHYGYAVLFAFVLAEQIGLPLPAVPILLGVGALAGTGRMSVALALATALAASLPADLLWYELGRRRGGRVLGVLCRISLEPDSCVRRAENLFLRQGKRALLVAKFVPGLSTIAPPLAGVARIARGAFVGLDALGALLWAGAWIALGWVARGAVDPILAWAARIGHWALGVAVAALGAYVLAKYVQRQRFIRSLRIARVTPQELKRRLDGGDGEIMVVDTRSPLDVASTPYTIPGAVWIAAEDIARRGQEIPRDRDIVVYCS